MDSIAEVIVKVQEQIDNPETPEPQVEFMKGLLKLLKRSVV